MRIQKVLVGTDLSEAGDEALRVGSEWAARFQAELFVCHVVPNPLAVAPLLPHENRAALEQLPRLMEHAEKQLRARVTQLTARGEEAYTALVTDGPAHVGLLEEAEQVGADLVVVGSLGHSAAGRLLLGSVAELVVRAAHCPVLVARPSPATHRILAATDFSPRSTEATALAAEVARRFAGKLTLLHAVDLDVPLLAQMGVIGGGPSWVLPREGIEALEKQLDGRLAELAKQLEVPAERMLVRGRAAPEILHAAEDADASLVVVGTLGRTGLSRLLMGSVAEKVVRSSPCSVLVVRPKA